MIGESLLLPFHQPTIRRHQPPLRKLHQQFLDHNLQSRIITPTLLQKVKTRILPRIRRNLEFLHTLWSLQEQNVCGEILINSYILQHFFKKNTDDNKLLYSSYSKTGKLRLWQ
ncbi:hypothetical protein H6G97_35545 [Nostoc flagelliforme FACHB-838]|uniref:Uncharacterized protein n=1 Tax=Nostoc flagelliforme FACHB-838 TaxID=2692904 RepID=A0ABR8DYT3_9NOSO|nr:hypothetical protein [Nostoc flagelliforme]MBD2534516.1 hypothetical protein [Nostoc flagelliforme FACHB-838]